MKNKLTILLTVLILHINALAMASPVDEQITRERQHLIEEDIRRSMERPAEIELPAQRDSFDLLKGGENCFEFKQLNVDNATLIKKDIKIINEKYQNYCITPSLINAIIMDINNAYIRKKAVTSRVYIPYEQEGIREGILRLIAIEGKIEEFIYINDGVIDNSTRAKIKINSSFPFQKGRILNLSRIEYGVDALNSIPSQNVRMEIIPGDIDGKSKVVIINEAADGRKNIINIGYDNSNSKYLNGNKATLSYTRYDIFGLNDMFLLSLSSDTELDAYSVYNRNLLFRYQVPIGRLFLSETLSISQNRTSTILVNGDRMRNDSQSVNSYTDIEYSLFRSRRHRLTPGINFIVKKNDDYIDILDIRTKIDVTSRQLSSVAVSLKYNYYGNGYMLYLKPAVINGVNWFGSVDDRDHDFDLNAQYYAGKLTLYSMVNVYDYFIVSVFGDSQHADKNLFSQDHFAIGGEGSVRGFKDSSLQGNSGFFIQGEITVPLYFYTDLPILRNILFAAFIDIGTVRQPNYGDGFLSGYGAKVAFDSQYVSAYYTYARKLDNPSYFEHPDHAEYFGIDLKVSF